MSEYAEPWLKRYEEETRELYYQRVLAILMIGIVLIPLFSVLDYMVVRQYAREFLVYRLGCAAVLSVFLAVYFSRWGKAWARIVSVIASIVSALTITLMCVRMGGYDSFYYVGVVMVLVAVLAILPLEALQATVLGVVLYAVYAVPVIVFSDATPQRLMIFFSNSFFFAFFIVISVLKCYEDTRVRKRETQLKVEMDGLMERLSYYAHNLEAEVDKRMKQLEESELRYRELYENIIDIVLLVGKNAKVLMANPKFYEVTGHRGGDAGARSVYDYIHPKDVSVVERMIIRLPVEQAVKDLQFRLRGATGKIVDVECNAKCITKNSQVVGFQLVLRDITVRKKLEHDLLESYKKVQSARNATILGLAKLAEYRDSDTGAHLERIREYCKVLAEELATKPAYEGYRTPEYIEDIYNSSILHDIGKVGIPDSILLKPGKLTPEEFEVVKRHSALGGEALKEVEAKIEGQSFLTLGKEIAYYHHEKWDGSGYPKGLKGEQIPLSARIVALADVYDALTSRRVYKEAYSHEEAKRIIVEGRGTHFAPDVVDAFLANEHLFRKIREEMFADRPGRDKVNTAA
ncbi:MAG TPA: HD domain-containing phosphohydrolase [Deltaproteobacteria bacterium]|nr:HD domain-containing phosphohydrolase [Deltaproteobacteria bacterium]